MSETWEHRFAATEHVVVGPGTLARLDGECEEGGMRRVVVVTGRSLRDRTPVIEAVERILGQRRVATFADVAEHTPASIVARLATLLSESHADGAVAVGGGSPIDSTKAALYELDRGSTRQIAVPTTLSAAEFTHTAGVTDDATKRKGGVAGRALAPRSVILDAEITVHTPQRLWLSSGIRALDHAVESVYAPDRDRFTIELCLRAIAMLREALPRCKHDAKDIDARQEAQVAAWYSGMGLASATVMPSHPLGRVLGASFDVPHGITSCLLLAPSIDWTARQAPDRVAPLVEAFEVDDVTHVGDAVRALVTSLDLPTQMRHVGLDEGALQRYLAVIPPEWQEIARAAF